MILIYCGSLSKPHQWGDWRRKCVRRRHVDICDFVKRNKSTFKLRYIHLSVSSHSFWSKIENKLFSLHTQMIEQENLWHHLCLIGKKYRAPLNQKFCHNYIFLILNLFLLLLLLVRFLWQRVVHRRAINWDGKYKRKSKCGRGKDHELCWNWDSFLSTVLFLKLI